MHGINVNIQQSSTQSILVIANGFRIDAHFCAPDHLKIIGNVDVFSFCCGDDTINYVDTISNCVNIIKLCQHIKIV